MDTRPPADPRSASLSDLDAPAQPAPAVSPEEMANPAELSDDDVTIDSARGEGSAETSDPAADGGVGGSPGANSDAQAAADRAS